MASPFKYFLCCTLLFTLSGYAEDAPTDDAAPEFTPGQTVRVELDGVGGNHILVYTPTDYDPARKTPLIVCYHGLNGQTTVEPFKKNLGGKGYVILGMEYFERGLTKRSRAERTAYNRRESDAAKRAIQFVGQHLNLDPSLLFLGGVSKGGWQSSAYAEVDFDFWAGLLIIAAGRSMPDSDLSRIDVRGKPIYIGVGETDENNDAGRRGKAEYEAAGAAVTFVEYAGLGHAAKPNCEAMRAFLLENGPLRPVRAWTARARVSEDEGDLGAALVAYRAAADALAWHEEAQAAAAKAEALKAAANSELEEAKASLEAADYTAAFAKAIDVARRYADSPPGDEAAALTERWRADPALSAEIEQAETDARADALEAIAHEAEAEKDYARALRTYARYVESFSGATRFDQVKARYDKLRSDEDLVRAAADQEAEADCKEWLSMADNYAGAGRHDLAKPYLQKIVDQYPESSWAKQARKRLDEGG